MEHFEFGGEIVWRPTPEVIALSNLQRFMKRHGLGSLPNLQRRSTTDISRFWGAVLDDLGIRFHRPWSKILDLSRSLAWQEWFVGGAWAWRSSSNVLDQMFENKTV